MLRFSALILGASFLFQACTTAHEDPTNEAIKLNEQGIDLLETKDFTGAQSVFHEALAKKPTGEVLAQIYRNLATVFYFENNTDSCRIYTVKALSNAQKGSYYQSIYQAELYLLDGKTKAAIAQLNVAVEKNKNGMEAQNLLSLIYNGMYGDAFLDASKALKYALRAKEISPSPSNLEQLASVYFELEQYSDADAIYSDLYAKNPEIKMYLFYKGLAHFLAGKEEEGMTWMNEAAQRDEACAKLYDQFFGTEIS